MNPNQAIASIATQRDVKGVIRAIVDTTFQMIGPDTAWAGQLLEEGSVAPITGRNLIGTALLGTHLPLGRGVGGLVAATLQPLVVRDYATDHRITKEFTDIAVGEERLRSVVCVPIVAAGGLQGLLWAGLRGTTQLGDIAVDQMLRLADAASATIYQLADRERERELALMRERQRLATQLHDSVAQTLFAIGVAAQRRNGETDFEQSLAEIADLAANARGELRHAFHQLNEIPKALALDRIIDGEVGLFSRVHDIDARVVRTGPATPMPEPLELLIADTVREGLRNTAKHTEAQLVLVSMRFTSDEVVIGILGDGAADHDDEAVELPADRQGGLRLLAERANQLHGVLSFRIEDGESELKLRLPVQAG
ncbi:MAG: hypothetical protein JWN65_420 [Solirubrobacterales bacterium]|nr:hypothetical protein [Solirubrobacterales bacterium]